MKILGVIFDNRLSFKSHIDSICTKVRNRINMISKLRHYLPQKVVNLIYKALVIPILDYSICVYGFTYSTHLERIVKLQRRAAHIITQSNADSMSLFESLGWKPFINRRNYFASICIYKSLNKLSANLCHKIFKYKSSDYKTRSIHNSEVHLPSSELECFRNSIFYSGVQIFNNISLEIRNNSFNTFVTKLKNCF